VPGPGNDVNGHHVPRRRPVVPLPRRLGFRSGRPYQEFESLEKESRDLGDEIGQRTVSEEIRRLRERMRARERGDVILMLGGRTYRIDRDIFSALPVGGDLLLAVFRLLKQWAGKREK
jgi:hypothetical protein